MKTLHYTFATQNTFSAPVREHQFVLHCTPRAGEGQTLLQATLTTQPDAPLLLQPDGFGNTAAWGTLMAPHTCLHYAAMGVVQVDHTRAAAPCGALGLYRHPGARSVPGPLLRNLYAALRPALVGGALQQGAVLCYAVRERLCYVPGATDTATTAEQALALGQGVCQDNTQVFVALARLAGLPARYCMGLTVGQGATHAWPELYANGVWHGFDPTRGCEVDETYLRFAAGRDAADCPVERGVFLGVCSQMQMVQMQVVEG